MHQYIDDCVSELSHDYPLAEKVLVGDFNQLPDAEVVERTGLTQIVHQPTRGNNILDRVFVSSPYLYTTVRVVSSVVKSDHKAVVVSSSNAPPIAKTRQRRTFRLKTPSQNASFLQHLLTLDLGDRPAHEDLDPQEYFDSFYQLCLGLLDEFYPERTVNVTSSEPSFMTAEIKAKLRRKNRLMRAGVEWRKLVH